jgi:hypothetical protein
VRKTALRTCRRDSANFGCCNYATPRRNGPSPRPEVNASRETAKDRRRAMKRLERAGRRLLPRTTQSALLKHPGRFINANRSLDAAPYGDRRGLNRYERTS